MPTPRVLLSLALLTAAGACGPSARDTDDGDCVGAECTEACTPGATGACYTGTADTNDVGACRGGTHTCGDDGVWGQCVGEVLPTAEVCGNGIDENCTGEADEDTDLDGDGFSTCDGDCCDSVECSDPELVNPGAFEDPANAFDDNCDGVVDEVAALCDSGLSSDSFDATDYARAIDICQTTTEGGQGWGLISAEFSLLGSGSPADESRSIRSAFGDGVTPQGGTSLLELSSGHAADSNDQNPDPYPFAGDGFLDTGADTGTGAAFPADFLAANGGELPNAPGCPPPAGGSAQNPIMLELRLRVPTNARSFSLATNFFSAEYPEWTCSPYNDFFVVLLDSAYAGDPANPADKNLATYEAPDGATYPVGVNLAYGDTGLFRECENGETGCRDESIGGNQSTCTGVAQLQGTGFDDPDPIGDACAPDSIVGGGTGWLTTSGNVVPGEIITLRIAIWDTSDPWFDSLVVLDNFRWSVDSTDPGTVID